MVKCEVFEDNVGAIELAKLPKLQPRTKHIAVHYHHFRTWTERGVNYFRTWTERGVNNEDLKIKVTYIPIEFQEADIWPPLKDFESYLLDGETASKSARKCEKMSFKGDVTATWNLHGGQSQFAGEDCCSLFE